MADERAEKTTDKGRHSISLERKSNRSRSCSDDDRRKTKQDKQKSRTRSHSDSEHSSNSSSSDDSDKKRTKIKLRKKKRKRSSSSESSSSDTDDKHSKSRNKEKKRKLKKEKKKSEKKKEKRSRKLGAVDQNKYGAYGIIRESDLFVKQQEFYCWLQEVKKTNPETLPKFETRKMFESYMEDYNTATLPHKKYYDLEKWEAKRQHKSELKALKKAKETSFSIADDEKHHEQLHRRVTGNKHAGPSRQQLLEMQQELRRRQDEEYRKKAGMS